MRFRRGFYVLRGNAGVHWRLNRYLFLWLGIFVVTGIVIAITIVFNPRFNPIHISNNLLDTNLPRVVRPGAGLGAIIMARIFSFALISVLVFVVCLHKWTVWLVYIITGYKGFGLFINIYWTIARFGATGVILFIVYFILLIMLLILTLVMIAFCLRTCAPIRRTGLRGALRWDRFSSSCLQFFIAITILAFVEWFLYWLILSRFVFAV